MASGVEEGSAEVVETTGSLVAEQEPDPSQNKEGEDNTNVTDVVAEQSAELAASVETKEVDNPPTQEPMQESAEAQTAEANAEVVPPEPVKEIEEEANDEVKQDEVKQDEVKQDDVTQVETADEVKQEPSTTAEEIKPEPTVHKPNVSAAEISQKAKKAAIISASTQKQKPIGSLHELDLSWKGQENPCEHYIALTHDFARPLLRVPHIEGKGSFMAAWRLAAVASGVNWDVRDGTTGSPQCVQISLQSYSAQAMQRARKYMRFILSADRGWIKVNPAASEDGDLTLLTCPEDLWSWVLGKQDSNLLSAADESGVLIFCIGDYRKLGSETSGEQINPWLEVGMQIEVKSKGDVRNATWTVGTVTEILRSRSIRAYTTKGGNKIESTVEPSSYRPHFIEGDDIEVCIEGSWKPATFQRRGTEGDTVIAERSGAAKELPSSAVRPGRSSPGVDEPIFQLAIFGSLHGRCGAQLRFMSAVDWKRPGYYSGHLNLYIPPGVDWKYEKVHLAPEEVSKCIGTKGDIRRALCRAAECVIDYLGPVAYVCGAQVNCFFACSLLEIVRTSKKGDIEGIPEGVEEFCDAVNIPYWVVSNIHGKGRKTCEQIEQSEGVMMFLFKPPGMDEEPLPDDDTHMFIFAYSQRARQRANIRLIQAVRQSIESYGALAPQLSDKDEIHEDVLQLKGDELVVFGQSKDRERKVLEKASGCAIEVFGQCVHLVGTLADRTRARKYMRWSFLHAKASNKEERAIPLASEDLTGRDDLTELSLTGAEQKKLLAGGRQTLDEIEDLSGTFIFFREVSRDELLVPGRVGEIQIAGRSFRVKVLSVPSDTSELQVRLCKEGEEDAIASSVTLLIWSHDSGFGAKTGRALAAMRVRQFLCGSKSSRVANAPAQATSAEAKDDEWAGKQGKGKGSGKKKKEAEAKWDNDDADWEKWGGNANGSSNSSKKQTDKNDVWANWGGNKTANKQDYWDADDSANGWNKWKGSAKNEWSGW